MRRFRSAAAACLAATLVVSYTCAGGPAAQAQTHHRRAREHKPSVEDQIEQLRQQMQSQIDELKQQLAGKDVQLQQAQQAAASAQAAADKAQAAATDQQQAVSENTSAVSTLQSSVNDLKSSSSSVQSSVVSIQKDAKEIKKAVESPDTLHYKGITISPAGSFIAAETVWRQGAMGDGLNTHFSSVPLDHSDNAQISEWQGSGRQSRIALKAIGDAGPFTLTGYYEMDWLGAGITSNNNQSNSYVLRQRQLWAQAALASGWRFTAGQMWSLATETTKGLQNGSEILPGTIDPNYSTGFVWTRQYGFRVTKDFGNKFFAGVSAENAEMLNPAGSNLPSNYVFGSTGTGGGLYNSTANYSFNLAPDIITKLAFEPGWGHFEIFNINRFFRDRIYPNIASKSSAGAFNDTAYAGGIGGGFRGPVANGKVSVGLKGLWGKGMGRYGDSTIADVTIAPWGGIIPLKSFSALSTVELNPSDRLNIYLNYGGDYVYRQTDGSKWGYGSYLTDMSGCETEGLPTSNVAPGSTGACGNQTKDVQEATIGYWYNIYKGDKGRFRQGFQYSYAVRNLWSGNGGTANPSNSAEGTDNILETSLRYYLP